MPPAFKYSDEKASSLDKAQGVMVAVNPAETYDAAYIRKTIRRVDLRLLPILGALYAFSLIDRSNLSLARVVGAEVELQLNVGERYSITTLLFFVPYILLEIPANMVGPRWWLGSIAFVWGSTMTAMGFVKDWKALAGCRVVLGACEAGFFPGCVYLISTWYIREEVQTRLALFYLLSVLVGGFTPIFAYGVSLIGKAAGLYAWRWIFVCILPDAALTIDATAPDKATFLDAKQVELIRERVEYDRGDAAPEQLTISKCVTYAKDFKIWVFAFLFLATTIPSYAMSFFLPVILAGMGYDIAKSQLLAAPPYAVSVVFGVIISWWADRTKARGPFIIGQSIVTIVGLAMTAFASGNGPRYAGTFLTLCGISANIPAILAFQSNNVVGQAKKSFASAMVIGAGGIGGIIASVSFREHDAPQYEPGLWTSIAFSLAQIVLTGALTFHFSRRNAQVRKGGKAIEGQEGFLYTL
ncbi:MFS general substrate transporter [Auricularia subglabra TFB-10046 SS5]|uniref:MFS general substrate transporter n=1 Tax=Auricularia subglabra (strain TFB-10046 / SS5) TaxID=717982 RepID=J0WVD4_AURST|nr:MFS general substrate transporter [Auricularia subglabra TFB-10046 SS5]